ncbi:MAG TPA: MmcQ/YjbR family DNA-binding protein [Polyangiaceae bacterium]
MQVGRHEAENAERLVRLLLRVLPPPRPRVEMHGSQENLIEFDPERYFRPPYVGHRGWVGVVLDTDPDWKMIARLIRDAYCHVANRKLIAQLQAHDGGLRLVSSSPSRSVQARLRPRPC